MAELKSLESSETQLDGLPDDVDFNVVAFVDAWYAALEQSPDKDMPLRSVLNAERLSRWRDEITLYEYQPIKDDFLIRIDAPSIVALNGESFQGSTPREIDLKYGTCLTAALFRTLRIKQPTFYFVSLADLQGKRRQWLRILLPAQTVDQFNDPVYQVLGVRFRYDPMHYI